MLAVTGTEALYADMSHFSRNAIRVRLRSKPPPSACTRLGHKGLAAHMPWLGRSACWASRSSRSSQASDALVLHRFESAGHVIGAHLCIRSPSAAFTHPAAAELHSRGLPLPQPDLPGPGSHDRSKARRSGGRLLGVSAIAPQVAHGARQLDSAPAAKGAGDGGAASLPHHAWHMGAGRHVWGGPGLTQPSPPTCPARRTSEGARPLPPAPQVVIATLAAIIASQALISGSFTIVQQARGRAGDRACG